MLVRSSAARLARAAALVSLATSVHALNRSDWQAEAKVTNPTQECADYDYAPVDGKPVPDPSFENEVVLGCEGSCWLTAAPRLQTS